MFPGTKNRDERTCGCSLVPKTGTRVHADVPLYQNSERGYIRHNRPFTKSSSRFLRMLVNEKRCDPGGKSVLDVLDVTWTLTWGRRAVRWKMLICGSDCIQEVFTEEAHPCSSQCRSAPWEGRCSFVPCREERYINYWCGSKTRLLKLLVSEVPWRGRLFSLSAHNCDRPPPEILYAIESVAPISAAQWY